MASFTRKAIIDSYARQLLTKPVDKITVKDIVEDCGISRNTFYYHFKDIMDVLEWSFRRATQELAQKSLNTENRIESLTEYVTFVRNNRKKLDRLLYSRRWVQIEGILVDAVTVYLSEIARNRIPSPGLSVDDMEVMLRFYASGMVGVLLQYVNKPNLNEEKLVIQIEKIITGKMFPGRHNENTI